MADEKPIEARSEAMEAPDTAKLDEVTTFHEPDADHFVYNVIGRIAAKWSMLESILDFAIYNLSGLPTSTGACVTAQLMGVWPRLYSIKALLTQRLPQIPEFKSTISEVNKMQSDFAGPSERRNRIIHDPWWCAVGAPQRIFQARNMPKSELIHGHVEIDPASLGQFLEVVSAMQHRVMRLILDIDEKLLASRGMPTPIPVAVSPA